ncbi:IclR family transcriptional regulator domain-containing protein [Paenarthrobacter aromaticivorans]|uniref:IclR family transcriptional regulator domain-containing protein n=1 Tax=Paenarthrobacter aromaticivorans TaxID=2849150 RepID=UPI0020B36E7C|nr:IclR family transcriptional regulator C-terminal domain-containing protein [Paenarthrobacter sp. MMS21-TAE1-1]
MGEVRKRIEETRAAGHATNPGLLVQGSCGMGAAVFDAAGQPAWALSITGIEARFSSERRAKLGRLLLRLAPALSEKY